MIDSQTQVRWLATAAALVVFVIGPATAGIAVPKTHPTKFTIDDLRLNNETTIASKIADADPHAMFLVPPGSEGECGPETMAACPSPDEDPVVVPMSPEVEDPADTLEKVFPDVTVAKGMVDLTRTEKTFGWSAALRTGALLLIAVLLAVAALVARQPRQPVRTVAHQDPRPSPRPPVPVVRDDAPASPRRPAAPSVLSLADVPGAREVVREHGATAKARSHIDGAGGYVVLGDVLMWATPVGGGVAFPDDDVHVTVSVTPTLDGGLRP